MNAKKISLALGTLALLSTGSAFAAGIEAQVGPIDASVGTTSDAVVGAPIVAAPACGMRRGLLGRLFSPPGGQWFDLDAFGIGVKLGGPGRDFYTPAALGPNAMIYPTASAATATSCGLETLSQAAVIPNTCGGMAEGLGGQRLANPWLDLHLFKWGFSAGKVNPDYDMRPSGDI